MLLTTNGTEEGVPIFSCSVLEKEAMEIEKAEIVA